MKNVYLIALIFLMGACDKTQPTGADRDAHGCIGTAGYSWCAKTQSCERPWELAKSQGFEDTMPNFYAFCDANLRNPK